MSWHLFWQLMVLIAWAAVWVAIVVGSVRGKEKS